MSSSMNESPLISVVVPVYRAEKFLCQCLDSILAQTYKNLEVILVDDSSPDNCGKICDEYARKDNRVRVIHQSNQGVSAARNAGLASATGEYIGFVDSDDYIEPDMYEYLYGLITKDNASVAMCNTCEDEGYHTKQQIEQPYVLISASDIFEHGSIWAYVWNKLYRRDFIADLRFDTTNSYGEDLFFNFELMKTKAFVALGNQAKYHYCCKYSEKGLTKNFLPKYLKKIVLMDECLEYAKQHNLTTFYRRASNAQLVHAAKWLYQIARAGTEDPTSVQFLTAYIEKNFARFLFARFIPVQIKLFVLVACINFDLARTLLLRFYRIKNK